MSTLKNPEFTIPLFAILVKRLGGKVTITQSDLDEVQSDVLEECNMDGVLEFKLVEQDKSAECQHCWHITGMLLLSNPPQTDEICCWCGSKQSTMGAVFESPGKHGPMRPNVKVRGAHE